MLLSLSKAGSRAQTAAFSREGLPSGVINPNPGIHLGRFDLHGGFDTSVAYDDMVENTIDGTESDVTLTFSPRASIETDGPNARNLKVTYRPSYLAFIDHSRLNNLNHFGTVDIKWPLNRLTLSLQENVSVASVVVRDISDRAEQARYLTEATADYEISHRSSLNGVFDYERSDYGGNFINYQQFTEQLRLDYHFGDRLTVGGGFSATQVVVDQGPGQSSEGPLVRATLTLNPEFSVTAQVGIQWLHFDSGAPVSLAETFNVTGLYQVRPGTSISLNARRAEQPSALLLGQNYTDTGFSLDLNQVLSRRLGLTFIGGYTQADYYATDVGVVTQRSDSYYFVRLTLNWAVTDKWTTGVFVDRSSNQSSGSFSYDHNVAGVQASWTF